MKIKFDFFKIWTIALSAWLSQSISFRVGNFIVSATNGGAPHHFSFNEALVAVESVFSGKVGQIEVGSTLITIAPR
jgi:hypothetical protein